MLVERRKTGGSLINMNSKIRGYETKGIGDKLTILFGDYGIVTDFADHIISLNEVRNCLVHRQGVAGWRDLRDDEFLTLKWRGFRTFVKSSDGEEIELPMHEDWGNGIYVEKGGGVCFQIVEKRRDFKPGEIVTVKPTELKEVFWMLLQSSGQIKSSTVSFLKNEGLSVVEKAPEQEALAVDS